MLHSASFAKVQRLFLRLAFSLLRFTKENEYEKIGTSKTATHTFCKKIRLEGRTGHRAKK